MQIMNAVSRVRRTNLTSKAASECAMVQHELQTEKRNTIIQTKRVALLRLTVQFATRATESLSFDREILRKSQNDAEYMRARDKAREALLAVEYS